MIIATLGGHSALEICFGAKKHGFNTLVIAQKGREKTYTEYYRNLIDEVILINKFHELTDNNTIKQLKNKNCLFIPHRYCQVYCDLGKLESDFPLPVFGNKKLLKYEEREGKFNQYQILTEADINYPKQFRNPKNIDRLVIVKVKEAVRGYERAFFFADSYKQYLVNSEQLIRDGKITIEALNNAVIEEYLIGAQINFNFFYSPLTQKIELLSTDIRRQTNIDGLLRIPIVEQRMIADNIVPSYIETGHIAVTVKESLLEKAFDIAEKIVKAAKKIVLPGIIGPFALQSAVMPGPPEEKIVVYDLSLRIPGSPGTSFTPYSSYLYGESISFGDRITMEIRKAIKTGKLDKITT